MSKHTNKVHGKLNFLIIGVVVVFGAVAYLLVQTGTIDPSMGTSSGIKGVKKAVKYDNRNKVVVDDMAPLYHVRKDAPPYIIMTGDRELELLGRYEENAYMMRMMKSVGHKQTMIYEFDGYGHGMAEPGNPILIEFVKGHTAKIIKNKN